MNTPAATALAAIHGVTVMDRSSTTKTKSLKKMFRRQQSDIRNANKEVRRFVADCLLHNSSVWHVDNLIKNLSELQRKRRASLPTVEATPIVRCG